MTPRRERKSNGVQRFCRTGKEQIQDFLPEKFADAAVEVNQIVKNNDCVLDGLMVRTEESNISPTIYLNPYFEQIQDGAELDDILAQIASVYQSHYIDHDIDVLARSSARSLRNNSCSLASYSYT